jgi:tripeptide aminopeptidase
MSERMVNQFMEMVKIDSESGNETQFINYLKEEFQSMGAKVQKDSYGNLIAKFAAKGCDCEEPILLSCHADTVKPGVGIEPQLLEGVLTSKGDTILGADDKAGIAEMLEAIRTATIHPPLEVAITRQEEVGLLGVKNFDFSLINAQKGFLLDNDTLDTIVVGGPSYFTFDVEIKGKAAHAGMEPEKGINAIEAAAKAIAKLKLGRLDNETTANVGVIKGGMIRNGVPDNCNYLAECRSLNHEKAKALAEDMYSTMEKEFKAVGVDYEIDMQNPFKAVHIEEDSWTVQASKKALSKIGIEDAKTVFITGFTDASVYNNMGIEMAVVGIGAKLEHSTDEHIYVADMQRAVVMIHELFKLSAE